MKKKRLKSISPLRAGIVLGVLYAMMVFLGGLIILLFGLAGFFSSGADGGAEIFGVGIGFIILAPLLYGILGFIGGVICAWFYNLIAKMTGGLEFTVEEV